MPLLPAGLSSDLEGIAADPPATAAECAQAWADAMEAYAAGIIPASTTASAAAATLATALAGAFGARPAAALLETAFLAFATTVGGGMAGFTPTPPPAPVGFAVLFAGPNASTHAAGAAAMSGIIDTWMRTGTATPTGGGPAVAWS